MDEINIIEEEVLDHEIHLELRGVKIEDEVKHLKKICNSNEEVETALPLYVRVDSVSSLVGYLDVTLDVVLSLRFISKDYELLLIESSTGASNVIFNNSTVNTDFLMSLIRV